MLPTKYSFKFLSKEKIKEITYQPQSVAGVDDIQKTTRAADDRKRIFLKTMSIASVGVLGALLWPKKADAFVFGSTPASNVVGTKNAANTRINPATEDTLTLIKAQSDKLQFDESNNLKITSASGATTTGITDSGSTRIDPATDGSIILLRRIVKLMESQAVVDSANRQRMTLDSIASSLTLSTITTVGTVSAVTTVSTVTSVTNTATIGSYATAQMFGDVAQNTYANAIRRGLTFS